jgi:hypothetical protein
LCVFRAPLHSSQAEWIRLLVTPETRKKEVSVLVKLAKKRAVDATTVTYSDATTRAKRKQKIHLVEQ